MKQAYPTFILKDDSNDVHSYLVYVPDLDIYTEGDNFTHAIEMARDAIGITVIDLEDNKQTLPSPSTITEAISKAKNNNEIVDFSEGTLTFVDVDFTDYRRKNDLKTVRRNVALPNWLDYEAERAGINVSRVLQDALMEKLNVANRY